MSNAKKPGSITTTTNSTATTVSTKVATSAGEVTGQKAMNTIENEEWELGIFTDDDESGGDLSDDEPPIEEQDTISGRPQSQFKLRVTSAIGHHSNQSEASGGYSLPGKSDYLDDYNEEQLKALDLNKDTDKTTLTSSQPRTSATIKSQQTMKQNKLPLDKNKVKQPQ